MSDQNEEDREELSESGIPIGIEASDDEIILEPFDPESISIEQKVVAMDTLIRRLKQGSILLAPGFQRSEVWNDTRRSLLIESLMLKIPLPMFYVAGNDKGEWEVVDGLQRLSTIRDFILGDSNGDQLKLKNLEFLGDKFNGKTYKAFENDRGDIIMQRLMNTIMEAEMRFTVINPGTPEEVKRNIFKRINTGGMPLTSQEIRHAMYQGSASNLLMELAQNEELIAAVGKNINDTRMGARELVLRFMSFKLFSWRSYKSNMDNWLSNAMRVINLLPSLDSNELEKIFKDEPVPQLRCASIDDLTFSFSLSMKRSALLFGEHAFRKSLPGAEKKSPINKALFATWPNILSDLTAGEFDILLERKDELLKEYATLIADKAFLDSISRHASQAVRGVEYRYTRLEELVNGIAGSNTSD